MVGSGGYSRRPGSGNGHAQSSSRLHHALPGLGGRQQAIFASSAADAVAVSFPACALSRMDVIGRGGWHRVFKLEVTSFIRRCDPGPRDAWEDGYAINGCSPPGFMIGTPAGRDVGNLGPPRPSPVHVKHLISMPYLPLCIKIIIHDPAPFLAVRGPELGWPALPRSTDWFTRPAHRQSSRACPSPASRRTLQSTSPGPASSFRRLPLRP